MIFSATLRGIQAHVVKVTATHTTGLPSFKITGLAPAAEREARVRVQAALANVGEPVTRTCHAVCDAGGVFVDGTGLDLAIALAAAAADKVQVCAIAELSLAGEMRPVRGVLAAVEAVKKHVTIVIVAPENAAEAALVDGVKVIVMRNLKEALRFASGGGHDVVYASKPPRSPANSSPDMTDIRGQNGARRALEIAAAGGHNVLLIGGPGAGKTMLARRLSGLLPAMNDESALEVTRVHSAAGLNIGGSLIATRPFRAPHHSTTAPGLVGGGVGTPRPGELALAHEGVLFLDQLPEFARASLEILSEPLRTGEIVLARASGTLRYPSRALVVGSMSACPCGWSPSSRCRCSTADRARYVGRISSRLLELFDVRVVVPTLDLTSASNELPGEPSSVVAARVAAARAHAIAWTRTRAERLSAEAHALLDNSAGLTSPDSRQRFDRVLSVAQTIAHLEGAAAVNAAHLAEALSLAGDVL